MSELFEGILCEAEPHRLDAAVTEFVSTSGAPPKRPAFRVRALTPRLSAAFVINPRHEGSFLEETAELALEMSRVFGQTLLVAYDTRVGCRVSALFVDGDLSAEFGEEDETFVPLLEDGTPDTAAQPLRLTELDPAGEYETVVNAVQAGLRQFGHPEAWAALRELISTQQA